MVVHALNGNPAVACAGEVLNPSYGVYGNVARKSKWRQAVHLRAITASYAMMSWWPWQKGAVGIKVLDEQCFYNKLAPADVVEALNARQVLLMGRHSMIRAFVSLQLAFANGRWYSEKVANKDSITLDIKQLAEEVSQSRKRWAYIERDLLRFRRDAALKFGLRTMYYESLDAEPEVRLTELTRFLGVEPGAEGDMMARTGASVKQNDRPLRDLIGNYDGVCKDLAVAPGQLEKARPFYFVFDCDSMP